MEVRELFVHPGSDPRIIGSRKRDTIECTRERGLNTSVWIRIGHLLAVWFAGLAIEDFDYDGFALLNRRGLSGKLRPVGDERARRMSHPDTPGDVDGPTVARVFDVADAVPYESQRTVQRYLSQETRHNILQVIFGHPAHLVSTTEMAYYVPRSRSAISDQLADLADHELISEYHHEPNVDSRDLPADFWGFTPFGVALLGEYNYLRGLPIMRAAHEATHKTETVQRHEAAPRPDLPSSVQEAIDDEPAVSAVEEKGDQSFADLREQTFYADAAPADPSVLNEDSDGNRTLDELF
jgi:hypothetical protein